MLDMAPMNIPAKETKGGKGPAPKARSPEEVADLSDDDLAELMAAVEQELSARQEKKKAEWLAQGRALGFDTAALERKVKRAASDRRATVAPKWRNPENSAQTWAGRGRPPPWIELGADGKTPLPKFAIKSF